MVTGGSGFIGSWLVKKLLEKGQTVRVTVRNKNNKAKVQHLLDMSKDTPGNLELWEADLLKAGSFDEAATHQPYSYSKVLAKKEKYTPVETTTQDMVEQMEAVGMV